MNWIEFDEIWGYGDRLPIFRHEEYGILIVGYGEFTTHGKNDVEFVGLWPPIDIWADEPAPYFVIDEHTTNEMLNYYNWTAIKIEDLKFTGKYYKR